MFRQRQIEAFARLLDGASPASVPAGVAAMGGIVAGLRAIPAPALPAGLAAGRAAFVHAAAAHSVAAAAAHPVAHVTAAKVFAGKVAAAKATLSGIAAAHLAPVVAGTALAAVAIGGGGAALGASRSLPGDPLYGLKRQIESVQIDATTNNVSAAKERLAQVRTRLNEAAALRDKGASMKLIGIDVHDWSTGEAAAVKVLGPLAKTDPKIYALLEDFYTQQSAGLATMPAAAVATPLAELASLKATLLAAKLPAAPSITVPKVTVPGLTVPTTLPSSLPLPHRTHTGTGTATSAPATGTSSGAATAPATTPTTAPAPAATHGGVLNLPTSLPTLPTALPTLPTNILPTAITSPVQGIVNGLKSLVPSHP